MAERVAAVVVAFNRKELLAECLRSLLGQTHPVDAIFVTDNASTDGTREYLEGAGLLNHAKIFYMLLPTNLGGAGGFAKGMEAAASAGYDWIWLMDDDAEPFADALELLLPFMSAPEAIALANLKLDTNGDLLRYHLGFIQWQSSLAMVQPLTSAPIVSSGAVPIEFSSFIGLLIRRDAIEKLGLPRREFFIHCDDFEYCVRLLQAGKIYLIPDSRIVHKEKIFAVTDEKHWGSSTYRRVPIEKYAFQFFGIRNSMWTLLKLSPESAFMRHLRVMRDFAGMAARIVLYERDHRLLRLRLLLRCTADALRGTFDNTVPFQTRQLLATKRGSL